MTTPDISKIKIHTQANRNPITAVMSLDENVPIPAPEQLQ